VRPGVATSPPGLNHIRARGTTAATTARSYALTDPRDDLRHPRWADGTALPLCEAWRKPAVARLIAGRRPAEVHLSRRAG
jgi:hypothetical protein